MGRRPQPPEYFEARRALNRHLHRHHAGASGEGTLQDRFEQHDELHILAARIGIPLGHEHGEYLEGESDLAAAHRLLREGQDQHGEEERGPDIVIAMDTESVERRQRRRKKKDGQADAAER